MVQPTIVRFGAIGTRCEVLCTQPVGEAAEAWARAHLAALDLACSRFRPDSEVSLLAAASVDRPGYAMPSALFRDHLQAALYAARLTDGLVDPTVGSAVVASGYDDDMDAVRARASFVPQAGRVPGWRSIVHLPIGLVGTPQGCLLDFGSTSKAHAADRLAAELAAALPGGFLVNLGGDIAVGGHVPDGGWRVSVVDAAGADLQVIATTGLAVATSSTRHRTWTAADGVHHHIVDPRTGRTSDAHWAQVTVCAPTALDANAAATASIILGADAPAWLEAHGLAARLDAQDGGVTLVGGWPEPHADTQPRRAA